ALAHELDAAGAMDLGRRAFTLLSRSAAGASARGEFRAARELNDRALAVAAGGAVPPAELASARALDAIVKLRLDSDVAAVSELDHAIDAARSLGPSTELVRLLVWRASSVTILDDIPGSERQFEEAIAVARETGDREILAYAVWASSEPLGLTGRLEEQAELLDHALAEAADAASSARQASGDLEGARTVLEETFAQLDPARMTIQRDAITRLETRRAEVALARGDIETARVSATTAVRIAPKPHVET